MKINFLEEHRRLMRIFIFGVMACVIFIVLLIRLFYMQVIQGDRYQNLAQRNRISVGFMSPARGSIFGASGELLAYNQKDYRLILIPRNIKNIDKSIEALSHVVTIPPVEIQRIKQTYVRLGKRSTTPILVQKHLNLDTILKLELILTKEVGGEVSESYSRRYPLKDAGAHVLGYIGALSQSQSNYQSLSKLGRIGVGKTGLEVMHEGSLFGKPGMEEVEVNATGQLIRVLSKTPAGEGDALKTTLRGDLQAFIYDLLSPYKSGSAVVMNAQTGAILALVSYPGFDPHSFEDGILDVYWQELLNDPYKPLTNKATSGLYAPGSSFKMIVALSALEMGIDPNVTHFCAGGMHVGNHVFHCHKNDGHGAMNMKGAIRESCDVYFYDLAQKVGIERIAKMAKKFGFGDKTALDFPSERYGLVPDKAWKEKNKKESWKLFDTIISSIGQGYILSTPMQLAQMTARLATGKEIRPYILEKDLKMAPELNVPLSHLAVIRDAMNEVVNHPFGTGYASRLENILYAGKTGTSQVKRISIKDRLSGAYRSLDRAWADKDHALFVGYGSVLDPEYVVVVIVEHGGSGSRVAAPLAKEIFHKMCFE